MSMRFYTTAEPTFVENKMFVSPMALMEKVILAKDKQAEKQEGELDDFTEQLNKVESLAIDDPIKQEKINRYKEIMEGVTNNIYGDMNAYNKVMPAIRELSKNLDTDLNTGVFGLVGKNLANRKSLVEKIEGSTYDQETKNLLIEDFDAQYEEKGGVYDKKTGSFNPYPDSYSMPDTFNELEAVKEVKLNSTVDAYASAWNSGSRSGTTTYILRDKALTAAGDYWDLSSARSFYTEKASLLFRSLARDAERNRKPMDVSEEKRLEFIEKYLNEKKEAFKKVVANELEMHKEEKDVSYRSKTEGERAEDELLKSLDPVEIPIDKRNGAEKVYDNSLITAIGVGLGFDMSQGLTEDLEKEVAKLFRDKKDKTSVEGTLLEIYEKIKNLPDPDSKDKDGNTTRTYIETYPKIEDFILDFKNKIKTYSIDGYKRQKLSNLIGEEKEKLTPEEKKDLLVKKEQKFKLLTDQPETVVEYSYTDNNGILRTGEMSIQDLFKKGVILTEDESSTTTSTTTTGKTESGNAGSSRNTKTEDKKKTIIENPVAGNIPPYDAWGIGTLKTEGDDYRLVNSFGRDDVTQDGGMYDKKVYMSTKLEVDPNSGETLKVNTKITIYLPENFGN